MNITKNNKIKEALQKRWKELDINKLSEVYRDAQERAPELKIDQSRMSRWLKDKHAGKGTGMTEKAVLWLCTRYGIPLSLNIGIPVLTSEDKLKFVVPPYDELECLRNLKKLFPEKEKIKEDGN